jgi:hypothetical protein
MYAVQHFLNLSLNFSEENSLLNKKIISDDKEQLKEKVKGREKIAKSRVMLIQGITSMRNVMMGIV